jgi:murein DD-endopeptidase MepM/ murein hydrolase activator NlpD
LNIILVSERLAKARTINIGVRQLAVMAMGVVVSVFVMAGTLNYLMLRYASELHFLPYLRTMVVSMQQTQQTQSESYLRDNLNAMAQRLGEMQAQLLRLDTLGERLAKLAGFKPQDFRFGEPPGRGGAVSSVPSRDFTLFELTQQIESLTRNVDDRGDKLGVLESLLTLESAKKKLIPTMLPVLGGGYNSNFGWRIDPFTGQHSYHEGIDFAGGEGTPILAAAGGVVVYAEYHAAYGNMVEIDHGNDLISRYAHASKVHVKVGDMVLRGVKIAEVGRTGRATGTHLHFEVRQRGIAVNPAQFLQLPG